MKRWLNSFCWHAYDFGEIVYCCERFAVEQYTCKKCGKVRAHILGERP